MPIKECLFDFANERDLYFFDKSNVNELGNHLVFTKYNKPIFSAFNYNKDNFNEVIDFVELTGNHCISYFLKIDTLRYFNDKLVVIIGKNEILIIEDCKIGSNLTFLKNRTQIFSFFDNYLSKLSYIQIEYDINTNNKIWEKCWLKLNELTNNKLEGSEILDQICFKLLERSFAPPYFKNNLIRVTGKLGKWENDKDGYNFEFQLNPVKINFYYYRGHYINGKEKVDYFLSDSNLLKEQNYTSTPEYLLDILETEISKYTFVSNLMYTI